MNREHLLQEASRLSRIVADDAMRVIEQRGLVERLRSGANLTELEQAEDALKAMLEVQSQHEHQLVQVQAKLLF
jgi:hypothetical protein